MYLFLITPLHCISYYFTTGHFLFAFPDLNHTRHGWYGTLLFKVSSKGFSFLITHQKVLAML